MLSWAAVAAAISVPDTEDVKEWWEEEERKRGKEKKSPRQIEQGERKVEAGGRKQQLFGGGRGRLHGES